MSEQTAGARFDLPGFEGQVFHPEDGGYDEARKVFNGMIDRRPALIARCASADDVAVAVNLARDNDLPLSVYGGGHGVTGSAVVDAGICIDLRGLKGIEIDPEARTVRAEGGLTWGEFDAATQEHGLAVTGGRVTGTGIAGLALGSGSGWLERALGYTCDSLLAAEVVTADGRQVRASEDENPELFWGLRGGGGNFGIVTAFHFRLHEVGPIVLGGMLMYPTDIAPELVRFYRDFMLEAPNAVGTGLAFISAPPLDFIPEAVRGKPVIGVVVCCTGPVEEAEELMRPLREFGPPALDIVQPMPYVAVQQLLEPGDPEGDAELLDGGLPGRAARRGGGGAHRTRDKPVSPLTQVILVPGGGAVEDVDEDAMAFGQRSAPWNLHLLSMWPDPADTETNIAWTRDLAAAIKPWTSGRAYLNFIGDEGLGRVEAAFGPEKYRRLQALKDEWDPENLFRHNQNIPPTAG